MLEQSRTEHSMNFYRAADNPFGEDIDLCVSVTPRRIYLSVLCASVAS
jgi:hypothetical protein